MKLELRVGDGEINRTGNELGKKLLVDESAIIPTTRKAIAFIIHNLGGNGSKDVKKVDLIPENPTLQHALKIIYHASNPRRKNPAMIGTFNGTYYKNSRDMLKEAQSYLAQVYGENFSISGTFSGVDRERWDKIKTPYGEFIQGSWNRTETEAPYGNVISKKNGVHLGESVIYKGNTAVVINASHKHNGLGEGTARIEIKYSDGSTEKVVPWLLEKVQ